ncbi:MAG TPA: cobalamin-binding protein [Myxococcota bacterium]|nr:cobalamin-binding protein [Myxococcota bacterium]
MELYPERIVCLTEETTEILYRLGEERRIVGISGYTVRPPRARREKPKVSAFIEADIPKITALRPDLVLGFSDLQADIAAQLIRLGVPVVIFNQRSIEEILRAIATVACLVGRQADGEALVADLRAGLAAVQAAGGALPWRPRVYFEEWPDPLISGIRWVGELIDIAGGQDVFVDRRGGQSGRERIVSADEVIARAPDVVVASWCGKKVKPAQIRARLGWEAIPAIVRGHVYEVKSAIILQPGPASLTEGVRALHRIIAAVARANGT